MPIGVWLSRRAIQKGLKQVLTRKKSLQRMAAFLVIATILNLAIMTHVSYSAVNYMEGTNFCGTNCHVMKPEYGAYRISPHARVPCVVCHVTPGATGWIESKMAGTRQLIDVIFNTYSRPIKSAMETNRLVSVSETCERCHWPDYFGGARLRIIPKYAEDEANTFSQTVLMMMVGGEGVRGIHGSHFGPGVSIRYASTDSTRQTIPWVEYKNSSTKKVLTYTSADAKPYDSKTLVNYTMQCVDCHNRPTHTFLLPERAVNRAMSLGRIPVSLPFIREKGVEGLRAEYPSSDEAGRRIPAAIRDYYHKELPASISLEPRMLNWLQAPYLQFMAITCFQTFR